MMRSLWAGVTGLQAHQIAMDVEGNNIANVNTTGFKYGRANFNDLMSQTAKVATAPQGKLGGKNPMQIGLGTQVNSVTKIFKQGSIQTTDKQTDLAIQGEGFFVVSSDGGMSYKYTRNGDFVRDSMGNFVDNNGYIAQGWMRDENTGEIDPTTPVKNIIIKPGLTTPANQTNYINLKANLNSGTNIGDKRTPIYELDNKSEWEDINDDGIKNDNNLHLENDEASNSFKTTKDRQLRLKERGVDVGVLFNASGESFGLRTGQGVWISYAAARTKQLSFKAVDNHGVFMRDNGDPAVKATTLESTRQLSIELNGIKISQSVNSIDDIVTAINAKSSKTGVRAVKESGNKLVLSNDNKTGTTDFSKNIHLKEDGDNGTDTTGLFGFWEAEEVPADEHGDGLRKRAKWTYSGNVAEHGNEENKKYMGVEVITAYQYTYDAHAVGTSHQLNSQTAREFHTTEDLRAAMQEDARLWVNYTGVQLSAAEWEEKRPKNDGVSVEVNAKGEFVIKNPKGDAFNEDDGDIVDITTEAVDRRFIDLWDSYVKLKNKEEDFATGDDVIEQAAAQGKRNEEKKALEILNKEKQALVEKRRELSQTLVRENGELIVKKTDHKKAQDALKTAENNVAAAKTKQLAGLTAAAKSEVEKLNASKWETDNSNEKPSWNVTDDSDDDPKNPFDATTEYNNAVQAITNLRQAIADLYATAESVDGVEDTYGNMTEDYWKNMLKTQVPDGEDGVMELAKKAVKALEDKIKQGEEASADTNMQPTQGQKDVLAKMQATLNALTNNDGFFGSTTNYIGNIKAVDEKRAEVVTKQGLEADAAKEEDDQAEKVAGLRNELDLNKKAMDEQQTLIKQKEDDLKNAQDKLDAINKPLADLREEMARKIHDYSGDPMPVKLKEEDLKNDEDAEEIYKNALDDYIAKHWSFSNNGEDGETSSVDGLIDHDAQKGNAQIFTSWDSYNEATQKSLLSALRHDQPWVGNSHQVDTDENDNKMFINISNLTDPDAGINENDKFMKAMQGMQGALTSGDGQRQTQGMFMSAHSSSVDIFDSLGSKHSIKFDFTKVGYTDDGGTEWGVVIQVPEPCEINLEGAKNRNVLTGRVRFNSDGSLQGFFPSSISFTANNGSTPNQNIELNFGSSNDFDGLTSYDRESNTSTIGQDGFPGGDLNGIRVDESGTIIGSFSNGRSFGLAQVAMATFTNNEGLEADGGNVFVQTSNSGEPIIGAATTGGRGKVQASSLEMSNVDLSRSLTQLIVIQRGYQANSKTITTSDQMLNTLLQLKQ